MTIFLYRETICCGTIFRGQNDEVMVDHTYIKPCLGRIAMCKAKALAQSTPSAIREGPTKGVYSDSSSDSGYDDWSNQGLAMSPESQGNHVAEQGNLVAVQGNRVTEHGSNVVEQGNLVAVQGNHVSVQEKRVITQTNLVSRQVADLMCHETIFQRQEVREMHLIPDLIASESIVGCYQPSETAIRN